MAAPATVSGICLSAIDANAQIYVLQWTPVSGADYYNVYRSVVPYNQPDRVNRSGITMTAHIVSFTEVLPNMNYYFFTTAVNSSGEESALQSEGTTNEPTTAFEENPLTNYNDTFDEVVYPTNEDMGEYIDEMRRREKWMLENDGVECYLLKRKWQGDLHTAAINRGGSLVDMVPSLPEGRTIRSIGASSGTTNFGIWGEGTNFITNSRGGTFTTTGVTMTTINWLSGASQPSDGDTYYLRYQDMKCECYSDEAGAGRAMHDVCYGTWIPGGYTPFKIRVSFPPSDISVSYFNEGIRTTIIPKPWTLWTPRVDTFDVVKEIKTGKCWEVVDVMPSPWRGQYTTQDMTLNLLQPSHIAYRFPIPGWPTNNIGAST